MTIGELSRRTGVKPTTIRFYESVGMMPQPPRSEGDRRLYEAEHLERLTFIKHGRELGFEMDAIRALLDLAVKPNTPCDTADRIAREHLAEVEAKLVRLGALRDELARMVASCATGKVATCRIIETLADHGRCAHAEH
ncbi:helix-turn-helix domain-containing protein [Caulobacter sp. 17J65-9]|uniref:MerR family transcriptional regulator n=1 Tax=Caulobacter sp. 17J65-9 TaxID=2709382 RepID=UPI0013C77604|nr:helix-turn-helix domain-containing protein [Caulobacter sp. 17J65-9]NEX91148.1 helix-turn-helix domain-containing protein [Caulobacter sp. 17J65-9]